MNVQPSPSSLRPDALRGRTALVTGVSRRIGIGYAIAARLAQAGAHLMVQGRHTTATSTAPRPTPR